MHPMKEALKRRRGKGIDLTIMIGAPHGQDQDAKTDLAPPGPGKADADHGMAASHDPSMQDPDAVEDAKELAQGDPDQDDVSKIMGMDKLADHEKTDLMNRNPRSLHERAMKHHLSKAVK